MMMMMNENDGSDAVHRTPGDPLHMSNKRPTMMSFFRMNERSMQQQYLHKARSTMLTCDRTFHVIDVFIFIYIRVSVPCHPLGFQCYFVYLVAMASFCNVVI